MVVLQSTEGDKDADFLTERRVEEIVGFKYEGRDPPLLLEIGFAPVDRQVEPPSSSPLLTERLEVLREGRTTPADGRVWPPGAGSGEEEAEKEEERKDDSLGFDAFSRGGRGAEKGLRSS